MPLSPVTRSVHTAAPVAQRSRILSVNLSRSAQCLGRFVPAAAPRTSMPHRCPGARCPLDRRASPTHFPSAGDIAGHQPMIDLYYWPTPNGHKITMFL
jgi:hypothetical protein